MSFFSEIQLAGRSEDQADEREATEGCERDRGQDDDEQEHEHDDPVALPVHLLVLETTVEADEHEDDEGSERQEGHGQKHKRDNTHDNHTPFR